MKWFLITLAIGLAASDKLDRTYLPPPGAQFSGGILGHHDAPLEPPHHTHSGPGPVIGSQEVSQPSYGINGEPVNFGDKIPKVPITTTSYAFSQTTTYPPGEGFETTALPINPITGLPIQLGQENFPFGTSQGQQNIFNLPSQAPTIASNIQPGFVPQAPTSAPANNGNQGYNQFKNQPLNQYPGQNVITPGGTTQVPGSVYPGQTQGQMQYPNIQGNEQQQRLLPTGAPDNQRLDQYGQNIVNPGGVVQILGSNQGSVQYPGGQTETGQQGFEPSTKSPINLQPSGNQYGVNNDGSQGLIPQGTYTGQPINVPTLIGTEPTQRTYQNQEPVNVRGSPSQYPTGKQNYESSVPTGSQNVFQPGSTPSTIPSSYNNGVSSTTPFPSIPSSTSSYSSVGNVNRPERPQAAADRNAVILNYENVRTPNGYSYSFDTSNGIHADESGIIDNGTKAQGSYSYIGDDGKVYSVTYTADENGFQPRGDHLPTPPPIPEAIQKVIEQAARDKAAGIVHDGSYDEEKYGDKQYQRPASHRQPQHQDANQLGNGKFNDAKDDRIKPIAGIKDVEYDEGRAQDQFNNNLPVSGTRKDINGNLSVRRPLNQISGKDNVQDDTEGNSRVSGGFDSPKGTFDGKSMPIVEEVINQQNEFDTKKQGSSRGRPMSNGNYLPSNEAQDINQNNQAGSNNRGPSTRRPLSGGETEKYPGSNVDIRADDFSETQGKEVENGENQNISAGRPIISNGSSGTINNSFDSVTGTPITENKKQMSRQRIKGNRRPSSTSKGNNQNKNIRPQSETYTQEKTVRPSIGENYKNIIENQQNDSGYYYQKPNNKFEQNTFPTRFSPQEVISTMRPDQRRPEYVEGTTLRPFMTPNVYDKNDRNSQTTPNGYRQGNTNGQSTTRRPFTTVRVTSPTYNSYTDYDDGDDYATAQDIGDDIINSSRYPTKTGGVTSRPYQPTQTTSRPQNVPGGQRTGVNQKGTLAPGRRTETSGTVSPGYTYGPTTQMPSQDSRFGSTEYPRRMKPQQRRPSNTVTDSTTAVGYPVTTQAPLGIRPTDYQTSGPNFKYTGTNVGSGYPTIGSFPGSGSKFTTPGVSTPQDYYTSTYGPTQGYPSTTVVPPSYEYTQGSGSQNPSETTESFQPTQGQTFQTGYHYGPPKSGPINLDGSGSFTPTANSGVFSTSPTATYQTNYQQGPEGFPSTTLGPVTSGPQGNFITSQPGTGAPESSPFGTYPGNYQNRPSTPDYANNIVSSTPGGKPVFQYPGSPGSKETSKNGFGATRPTYSTTNSPPTIGTTPGSFIPSETTGPSQGYSTTDRPGSQNIQNTFVGSPVDGFGRPINAEQGGSQIGYGYPGLPGVQETPGNGLEPAQPTYSSTNSPPTIGTTPGSFIPPETTGPSQGYSTTDRPGSQNIQNTFVGGPVDGFGKPINGEQGGSQIGYGYPGSPGAQETPGNGLGPARLTYSTTYSPSTIGTSSGSLIPSESSGPYQEYSTTYRPIFQNTKNTFAAGPVDGFGRPIITEQGGSQPGYGNSTQGTTGAANNLGPNFGGTDQSSKYPGSFDQTRVIGEDFSGPKQLQRFDPKTGYHY